MKSIYLYYYYYYYQQSVREHVGRVSCRSVLKKLEIAPNTRFKCWTCETEGRRGLKELGKSLEHKMKLRRVTAAETLQQISRFSRSDSQRLRWIYRLCLFFTVNLSVQVSRSVCVMTTQVICKLLRSKEALAAVDVRTWPPVMDTGTTSQALMF